MFHEIIIIKNSKIFFSYDFDKRQLGHGFAHVTRIVMKVMTFAKLWPDRFVDFVDLNVTTTEIFRRFEI